MASSSLESFARERFSRLTEAEVKVVRAAQDGIVAVCGPNSTLDFNPANDVGLASSWGENRNVRADLIQWLCTDREARSLVAERGIRILSARITGPLDISNMTVPFPIFLQGCVMTDVLNLHGTRVPEINLESTWGKGVIADGSKVEGNFSLRNGFRADGPVILNNAQIGGDLDCYGGKFINPLPPGFSTPPAGMALVMDGATISGSIVMHYGFRAEGEVRLLDAQVGGYIDCIGAEFVSRRESPEIHRAITADRLQATGGIMFGPNNVQKLNGNSLVNWRTRIDGVVTLVGARLGGDLNVTNIIVNGGFSIESATIRDRLFWRQIEHSENLYLVLSGASATTLVDDESSWPTANKLFVDGFVYQRFGENSPSTAAERLKWLARMPKATVQPYQQLARVLRESGDEDGSKDVLVEMESKLRANGLGSEVESLFLRRTIGYGYHPLWALNWLALLSALGWVIYRRAHIAGTIVPKDRSTYHGNRYDSTAPPPHYPRFSPALYSIENSLPLVKLGQAECWHPDPERILVLREPLLKKVRKIIRTAFSLRFWERAFWQSLRIATRPRVSWRLFLKASTSPVFLQRFLWFQIIVGWILATLFAAGIVGLVKH